MVGGYFDGSQLTASFFVAGIGALKAQPIVQGTVLRGGKQRLDGFEWLDVTFIGTQISYEGHDVKLVNVKFINCTFALPPTEAGARVADYAALLQSELTFGG